MAVKEKAQGNGRQEAAPKAAKVRVFRPVAREITVPIRGIEGVPLVENKFSEKSLRQIADKQQKKAQGPRDAKDPESCFRGAMHLMPGAKATDKHPDVGFPASGFRKAIIAAANIKVNGISKTAARGAVFVLGDGGTGLVRIDYKEVRMREDPVRNDNGGADLRYRPEFTEWSAQVRVQYNAALISAEQVVNLMSWAGFSVGVGEGRPAKEGEWGRWEVPTVEDSE